MNNIYSLQEVVYIYIYIYIIFFFYSYVYACIHMY